MNTIDAPNHDNTALMPPTVSIIMAAFNASTTIASSINSVLSQTFHGWELIIYNDCSTDNTASIVETYADKEPRIRLYTGKQNVGVAMARNHAICKAKGQWLAFLDSDDLWQEGKLEKQLYFAKNIGAIITYTSTAYMNESGRMFEYILPARRVLSFKTLLRRNIMSCSSIMIRRDAMIPFPQGYMHEDYAVWMQIVKKVGHAYGLNEPLLIYRISRQSKSSGRVRSAKMTFGAYRQVGYGVLTSLVLTIRYAIHSIPKRLRIKRRTSAAADKLSGSC